MKLLNTIFLGILTLACCVIALFLFLLWSRKPTTPIVPTSNSGYTLEALAVNITILEIVLGLVGFVIAVLSFFGYTEIKRGAERAAREVAESQMQKFIKQQEAADKGPMENPGSFSAQDAAIEGAEPATEE